MKLKNKFQRAAIFMLALILASISSLAVYASVSYDSSKDPIVAYSGMVKYVEETLKSIRDSISLLDLRLKELELTGSTGGSSSGGMSAEQYAEIMAEIEALKKSNEELKKENSTLKNDIKNAKNELLSLIEAAKRSVDFTLDGRADVAALEALLAPYGISFGNRIALQIESFVKVYAACLEPSAAVIADALDIILLSKVVRKLELKSIDDKETLADEIARLGFERCARFVVELRED